MVFLKIKECLRVCGPKSVYALILVAHHEQIPVGTCKKSNDVMLYL